MRVAVFASGSGSNFQVIAEHYQQGKLMGELVLLFCDSLQAYALERAKKLGIPTFSLLPKSFLTKKNYEEAILEILRQHKIDLIVLAGYMRLVGETLLLPYHGRIINLHPSLLPAFPGKDAIAQAFHAQVRETGVTVHFVDQGMDTGPIIMQRTVMIEKEETLESLAAKIHQLEHQILPEVIQLVVTGKVYLENNNVIFHE